MALKSWLVGQLRPITEADPYTLADFIVKYIGTKEPASIGEKLRDFLGEECDNFTSKLLRKVNSQNKNDEERERRYRDDDGEEDYRGRDEEDSNDSHLHSRHRNNNNHYNNNHRSSYTNRSNYQKRQRDQSSDESDDDDNDRRKRQKYNNNNYNNNSYNNNNYRKRDYSRTSRNSDDEEAPHDDNNNDDDDRSVRHSHQYNNNNYNNNNYNNGNRKYQNNYNNNNSNRNRNQNNYHRRNNNEVNSDYENNHHHNNNSDNESDNGERFASDAQPDDFNPHSQENIDNNNNHPNFDNRNNNRRFNNYQNNNNNNYNNYNKRNFNNNNNNNNNNYNNKKTNWIRITKIPKEYNSISQLNEYFSQFGTVVSAVVDDASSAHIQFGDHQSAYKAIRSTEPIFQNRFVKVYWANNYPNNNNNNNDNNNNSNNNMQNNFKANQNNNFTQHKQFNNYKTNHHHHLNTSNTNHFNNHNNNTLNDNNNNNMNPMNSNVLDHNNLMNQNMMNNLIQTMSNVYHTAIKPPKAAPAHYYPKPIKAQPPLTQTLPNEPNKLLTQQQEIIAVLENDDGTLTEEDKKQLQAQYKLLDEAHQRSLLNQKLLLSSLHPKPSPPSAPSLSADQSLPADDKKGETPADQSNAAIHPPPPSSDPPPPSTPQTEGGEYNINVNNNNWSYQRGRGGITRGGWQSNYRGRGMNVRGAVRGRGWGRGGMGMNASLKLDFRHPSLIIKSSPDLSPDTLRSHFSKFGNAVVNVENRASDYIVEFKSIPDAEKALEGGKIFNSNALQITWLHKSQANPALPSDQQNNLAEENQAEDYVSIYETKEDGAEEVIPNSDEKSFKR